MRTSSILKITLLALSFFSHACALSPQDRVARHFSLDSWEEAFAGHYTSWETQGVPELFALATLPYVQTTDRGIRHEFEENIISSERAGLNLSKGLELLPLTMGLLDVFREDEGAMVETWLEAEILNHSLTHGFKRLRGRERPNKADRRSFPSGAASNAFFGSTLAARWIADQGETWEYKLGYLLYIPALTVARSRVENDKHWPSDVVAGALLGAVVSNTIYNLHFGDKGSGRGGIFSRNWGHRVSFVPFVDEEKLGLGLALRF